MPTLDTSTGRMSHIITGLPIGRRIRIYVTQTNRYGITSALSAPADIIVGGEQDPMPVPVLALDSSSGPRGITATGGNIALNVRWSSVTHDELRGYILYSWLPSSFPQYDPARTVYAQSEVPNADWGQFVDRSITTHRFTGLTNNTAFILGLVSIGTRNGIDRASDFYIIPATISIETVIAEIDNVPIAEAGVLSISITAPAFTHAEIRTVNFYRDGEVLAGSLPFISGRPTTFTDSLGSLTAGLTHFYRYAFVDMNGNVSPLSPPTQTVTARLISTEVIDAEFAESLRFLFDTSGTNDMSIEQLRQNVIEAAITNKELAAQLRSADRSFAALYENYQIAAENIRLLSAASEAQGDIITTHASAIEQNATAITMKVSETTFNERTNSLLETTRSLIDVEANKISLIVAGLNGVSGGYSFSEITSMRDQIQLKVDRNGVISAINVSPEAIVISGNRLHVTADTYFDRDVCIRGKLFAHDVVLLDESGNIVFGTGSSAPTFEPVRWGDKTVLNTRTFNMPADMWQVIRQEQFNLTSTNPFASVFSVNFSLDVFFAYAAKVPYGNYNFGANVYFRLVVFGQTVPQYSSEGVWTQSGGSFIDYVQGYEGQLMLFKGAATVGAQNFTLSRGTYQIQLQARFVPFGVGAEYGSFYSGFDEIRMTRG